MTPAGRRVWTVVVRLPADAAAALHRDRDHRGGLADVRAEAGSHTCS